MEKKFIEQSDRVITLTEAAKKYIENHFKLKREIAVIPCSTDLTLFSRKTAPADDEELTKARQEEKTILVYLGSIGTWYLLDRMLQFFKIMKEIKPAVFLIITPNSREAIIEEAGKMGIISSDLIVRKSIRSDIPKWLSSADAGIFFIKPVFSKTASSPVKHGEMMACELPVVTNAGIGDVDDIITKSDTGVIVHDWEEETLKRAAKKLFELIVEEDRSRYQAAANQYYSLMSASARYLNIYRELSK